MKACVFIAGAAECIFLHLGQVHNITILRYRKRRVSPNYGGDWRATRISGVGETVLAGRGTTFPLAVDPQRHHHCPKQRSNSMDTKNRIAAACEVLNLIADYANLCETYNVQEPEMGGVEQACNLVRERLETLAEDAWPNERLNVR